VSQNIYNASVGSLCVGL